MHTLKHFIDGEFVESLGKETQPKFNPANKEQLAIVPLGADSDVDRAVRSAQTAFESWRNTPAVDRCRMLFRYKTLIDEHSEELSRIVTLEHGKTLNESRGSVKRGIENVERACGIGSLMLGESLEDIAQGIDTSTFRQPMGVFAAITPYNFPAMIPMWFWPYALMTGNTFVLKPSEKVPLSSELQMQLIQKAGFPSGIINMVHGAREVVNALMEHPQVQGISFVGSTPIAKHIYQQASLNSKRVQALGGAKNHAVIMPDCKVDETVSAVVESAFGCAGQRCLAASVVVLVGEAYEQILPKIVTAAKQLRLGNGLDANTDLGPLISQAHKNIVLSFIEQGQADGAELLLDGRAAGYELGGNFLGASIFTNVKSSMSILKEEIFGPVMCVARADNLEHAISMIKACPLANATSIFTRSGAAARKFKHDVGVSMIGVNIGVAAPMAFFPFGGTKNSFFGDTKAHGNDSIRFYTDTKVVISRWF